MTAATARGAVGLLLDILKYLKHVFKFRVCLKRMGDIDVADLFAVADHIIRLHMGDEKTNREIEADKFATNALINACDYQRFVKIGDFSISSIIRFAKTQNVMPYIVIGRLQKEERIPYNWFSEYKLRYKWAN